MLNKPLIMFLLCSEARCLDSLPRRSPWHRPWRVPGASPALPSSGQAVGPRPRTQSNPQVPSRQRQHQVRLTMRGRKQQWRHPLALLRIKMSLHRPQVDSVYPLKTSVQFPKRSKEVSEMKAHKFHNELCLRLQLTSSYMCYYFL